MAKTNWVDDIAAMHTKFSVNENVRKLDKDMLLEFLKFRARFLQEELDELNQGIDTMDADLIVDSLVDLLVVAIGTLDAYEVDAHEAWNRVHAANMTKSPGIKASRPNKFGLPDLIKPADFVSPQHHDNIGLLAKIVK